MDLYNYRMAALDFAIKAAKHDTPYSEIVLMAEAYYKFIMNMPDPSAAPATDGFGNGPNTPGNVTSFRPV